MHTHKDDDLKATELRATILDSYNISYKEPCTSFKKRHLKGIVEKKGINPNKNCYFCEEDNQDVLEKHHIIPDRYGGQDSEFNLVTLCSNCHQKIEELYTDRVFKAIADCVENTISQEELKIQEAGFSVPK